MKKLLLATLATSTALSAMMVECHLTERSWLDEKTTKIDLTAQYKIENKILTTVKTPDCSITTEAVKVKDTSMTKIPHLFVSRDDFEFSFTKHYKDILIKIPGDIFFSGTCKQKDKKDIK